MAYDINTSPWPQWLGHSFPLISTFLKFIINYKLNYRDNKTHDVSKLWPKVNNVYLSTTIMWNVSIFTSTAYEIETIFCVNVMDITTNALILNSSKLVTQNSKERFLWSHKYDSNYHISTKK